VKCPAQPTNERNQATDACRSHLPLFLRFLLMHRPTIVTLPMTAAAANTTAANMSLAMGRWPGRRTQLEPKAECFLFCSCSDFFFVFLPAACARAGTALALEQPASSVPYPHQNIMTFCLSRSGCCLS
jgi:hypothetical protein